MLSNKDMETYLKGVKGAKNDIMAQYIGYRMCVGEVQKSYKMVMLDKLWKLSALVGEHYQKCLASMSELEAKIMEEVPLGEGRYALPQIEKMLEKTLAQPSDTPVAVIRSVPSVPHPPSFD